jgi:hypothetical protein
MRGLLSLSKRHMGTSKYSKTRFVIASEAKQSCVFAKNYGVEASFTTSDIPISRVPFRYPYHL